LPQVKNPASILIVRLSALGDVIQTLPVLACLRECYPDATIGWLVESDAAELLEGHPWIDHLHVSHRKRWTKALLNPLRWKSVFQELQTFRKEIRQVNYDVALDFQGLLKSSLTLYWTGIRHRIGFACAREMAPLFYTESILSPSRKEFFAPDTLMMKHFFQLLQTVGCNSNTLHCALPPITPSVRESARQLLNTIPPQSKILALAPATQWKSKHWPTEHWTHLIEYLLENTPFSLILVGSKSDLALTETILSPIPLAKQSGRLLNLTGKTSLLQLRALFEIVDTVIGPDSLPLHLAGAVGHAKLIGLYGPTAHHRTPPPGSHNVTLLTAEADLPCQPCDQATCALGTMACMVQLSPEKVIRQLLAPTESNT
jgi:lipopolysaccharide heptosyltransferase I